MFLLDKVERTKYPESETCHPEGIDARCYYRLCDNFWWCLTKSYGSNLDTIWAAIFLKLILKEFCDFSGTWNLRYLIFLRTQCLQKIWFQANFWFSGSKLGPKMNQNDKFSVRPVWDKFQNFQRYFKQCVCLIGLPLVKILSRSIVGIRAKKKNTRGHFMDAESIQEIFKIFNFVTTYWYKIHDVTTWFTSNCNTHIVQYLKK